MDHLLLAVGDLKHLTRASKICLILFLFNLRLLGAADRVQSSDEDRRQSVGTIEVVVRRCEFDQTRSGASTRENINVAGAQQPTQDKPPPSTKPHPKNEGSGKQEGNNSSNKKKTGPKDKEQSDVVQQRAEGEERKDTQSKQSTPVNDKNVRISLPREEQEQPVPMNNEASSSKPEQHVHVPPESLQAKAEAPKPVKPQRAKITSPAHTRQKIGPFLRLFDERLLDAKVVRRQIEENAEKKQKEAEITRRLGLATRKMGPFGGLFDGGNDVDGVSGAEYPSSSAPELQKIQLKLQERAKDCEPHYKYLQGA